MIDFINFLVLIVWGTFKLMFSMLMCCVTILCLKTLIPEVAEIFKSLIADVQWTWEEIKQLERVEFGD